VKFLFVSSKTEAEKLKLWFQAIGREIIFRLKRTETASSVKENDLSKKQSLLSLVSLQPNVTKYIPK
jgi:hypothetical protein